MSVPSSAGGTADPFPVGGVWSTVTDLPPVLLPQGYGDDSLDVVPDAPLPARPSQSANRRRRRRPKARSGASVPFVELALVSFAVLTAAWPWTAVFDGSSWTGGGIVGPLALGVAVSVVAVAVLRRLWWIPTLLISLVVLTVTTSTVLFADRRLAYLPDGQTWRGLGDGVLHGWAYLLTITLPADARGAVAVTPVLLTGLGAVLGALLVTRTRVALLPLLAPLLTLLPALLFSAGAGGHTRTPTAVLLVLMLALAVRRTSRLAATGDIALTPLPTDDEDDGLGTLLPVAASPGAAGRVGSAAFSSPVVALVAVGAVVLAPLLAISDGSARFDPRTLRHEEVKVDEQVTPLSTLKTQLSRDPALALFTVNLVQPADRRYQVDRMRAAVLTTFDGATWSAAGTYRRADSVLPPGDDLGQAPHVRQRILLSGLSGPYLPVAGRPLKVKDAGAVGFDPDTGVLVTSESTLGGLQYDVVGVATAHGNRLTRAVAAEGPAPALLLPHRPLWVTEALEAAGTTESDELLTQLKALETYLLAQPYALDVPSGHSYFRIERMVAPAAPGDHSGFAEQRASAFAVLARALGVPSRVVVGYELRRPAADGTFTVTTSNLTAWPEVHLQDVGWVAFDPTGSKRTPPPAKQQKDAQKEGTDNSQREAPDLDVPPVLFDDPDPAATDPGPLSAWERLARIGSAGGLALLAFVLLVLLLKWARRLRRRRSGPPARRVLGAWQEVVDRLTEAGLRPSAAQTPEEVVAALSDTVGDPALAALHPLTSHVSHALYAPTQPAPEHAAQAWSLSGQACRELRRGRGAHRRLLARVDPRPLVPRRGSSGPREPKDTRDSGRESRPGPRKRRHA